MNERGEERDYARAAALRQATFELLEEHTQRGHQASDPQVITCLQDAANRLGAAEQSLLQKLANGSNGHGSATPAMPMVAHESAQRNLRSSGDAAIVLAHAETLVPVAPSRADEAERWLRVMRQYGYAGTALEDLGMASGEFSTPSVEPRRSGPNRQDQVAAVADDAARFARDRGSSVISTIELLFAVMRQYGSLFDRALYSATGKTRDDLLAALTQVERVA